MAHALVAAGAVLSAGSTILGAGSEAKQLKGEAR